MTYHYLAFFMGLFGSLHCVAMCGPLLIAAQGHLTLSWRDGGNRLLYHVGRVLTYGALGMLLGSFGNLALIQGGQRWLSLVTGMLLLMIGVFHLLGKSYTSFAKWQSLVVRPFAKLMGKWLYRPGGSLIAGVLNGILPCGMVYMALASAMNAASISDSFLFMILFGLGTLPLLFVVSFARQFSRKIKMNFNKWLPALYIVMGIWFLLRGANLDIPFLSPLIHIDGAAYCG